MKSSLKSEPKCPAAGMEKIRARQGRFASCVDDVSLLETLPVIASRAFGNAYLISSFGPFREHPRRSVMQRLEISWSAEIEFAPPFFHQKTKGQK